MKSLDILICVHSKNEFQDNLLRRALQSLVDQTYRLFKVVIVLDSCWENTRIVIHEFKDKLNIMLVKHQKIGLAFAKNFGLKYCDADYIMFLDADDYYGPDKIKNQLDYLAENSDVDFLFCQAFDVHPDGRVTDNCFKLSEFDTHEKILAELPNQNCLHHGTACIRHSALNTIGGYPENKEALGREDYWTWLKAINSGFKFYNLPIRDYFYSLGTSVER